MHASIERLDDALVAQNKDQVILNAKPAKDHAVQDLPALELALMSLEGWGSGDIIPACRSISGRSAQELIPPWACTPDFATPPC